MVVSRQVSTQRAWASLNDRILKCRSADARHNPRQSIELRMEAITENVENCSIRVDSTTQRGSAIDVVRMVLGCTASAAYSYYTRLLNEDVAQNEVGIVRCNPSSNLSQRCEKIRINGKGKLTPVADAKTLVEIVFLLPGKTAREFRRQSAAKVCRLLGGDTTLVSEIEQRRAALESTAEGRATQSFLLAGSTAGERGTPAEIETYEGMPVGFRYLDATDRQAVAKQVVKHELQRQAQALEHQEQAMKRQRCDDMFVRYRGLMNLKVELDDRTKIELRDNVSILTKQDLAMDAGVPSTGTEITVTQDPSTPTHTLDAGQRGHETGIVVVATKLRVRVPPNMSGQIGKLIKALYKQKYKLPAEWNDLPKRQTLYQGRPIHENCYYARDEDIVEQAIRTKLKIPE